MIILTFKTSNFQTCVNTLDHNSYFLPKFFKWTRNLRNILLFLFNLLSNKLYDWSRIHSTKKYIENLITSVNIHSHIFWEVQIAKISISPKFNVKNFKFD
jgi:hypothetical protein